MTHSIRVRTSRFLESANIRGGDSISPISLPQRRTIAPDSGAIEPTPYADQGRPSAQVLSKPSLLPILDRATTTFQRLSDNACRILKTPLTPSSSGRGNFGTDRTQHHAHPLVQPDRGRTRNRRPQCRQSTDSPASDFRSRHQNDNPEISARGRFGAVQINTKNTIVKLSNSLTMRNRPYNVVEIARHVLRPASTKRLPKQLRRLMASGASTFRRFDFLTF